MLDLRLLQTFREVAMRGSFSVAAEELGFTQPAISQHLARLERHLGVRLLERDARGVTLTSAGEALLAETDGVLSAVRRAENAAKVAGGIEAARVRVGAFASAAAGLVPGAVRAARCSRAKVECELDLRVMDPEPALNALARGKLDIALLIDSIVGSEPTEIPAEFDIIPVAEDPMMVVLGSDHPLASHRSIALEELADEPFLLTEIGGTCADTNMVLHACRRAGFVPNVRLESEDYNALQGLAAAGMGVAIVPRMAIRDGQPGIIARPLRGIVPTRQIKAAVLPERSAMVDAFVDALATAGHELNAPGRLAAVA